MKPPSDKNTSSYPSDVVNTSRERCINLALELTRVACRYHQHTIKWQGHEYMTPVLYSYYLFDGAVGLAGGLSQFPPHPKAQECLDLMDQSIAVLDELANSNGHGEADTAKRAVKVLTTLRKAGLERSRRGTAAPTSFVRAPARVQPATSSHPVETRASICRSGVQQYPSLFAGFVPPPDSDESSSQPSTNHPSPFSGDSSDTHTDDSDVFYYPPASQAEGGNKIPLDGSQTSFNPQAPAVFSNLEAQVQSQTMYDHLLLSSMNVGFGRASHEQLMVPVMPYEALHGMHTPSPDPSGGSRSSPEVAMDWARLAGIDDWYMDFAASI